MTAIGSEKKQEKDKREDINCPAGGIHEADCYTCPNQYSCFPNNPRISCRGARCNKCGEIIEADWWQGGLIEQ